MEWNGMEGRGVLCCTVETMNLPSGYGVDVYAVGAKGAFRHSEQSFLYCIFSLIGEERSRKCYCNTRKKCYPIRLSEITSPDPRPSLRTQERATPSPNATFTLTIRKSRQFLLSRSLEIPKLASRVSESEHVHASESASG